MNQHAFLSASGAAAWMRCEAKPWREKDLPDTTNAFAEEGTRAHELLELYLTGNPLDRRSYIGFSSEMHDNVQKTMDYIDSLGSKEIYSEQRLDISFITGEEGAKGTADAIIIVGDTMVVLDLKYGRVRVEAEGNEQLLIYGAAAIGNYNILGDIKFLHLVISQPRLDLIDKWILTVEEAEKKIIPIREQGNRILTTIAATKGGDPNLRVTPGETQCKYCKVKLTCPERNALPLTTVVGFVDLDKEDELLHKVEIARSNIHTSNDSHLAYCMEVVDTIEEWCKDIRKETYKRMMQGEFKDSRFKLVQGRGSYQFINDGDLIKEFGDTVVTKEVKLKSPYKLRTEYKKDTALLERIEQHIIKVEGQPTIVPVADKRPALEMKLMFDPITDDDDYIDAVVGLSKE